MDKKGVSTCVVCGETSDQVNLHYSRLLCNGCRAFFKRTVQGKVKFSQCKLRGECQINIASRKNCKPCRYDACLRAGVDKSKVQPSRDSVCPSPEKRNVKKSVFTPSSSSSGSFGHEQHQNFRFQQPPFILPNFYPQVQHDLAYQPHSLPVPFDNRQMAPPAPVFPFPANPAQAPSSSLALFPPAPNTNFPEIQHGNYKSVSQNLVTTGHPDSFITALAQSQVPLQSHYPAHNGATSYLYGKTPTSFHPADVTQFQLNPFSQHGAHSQTLNHGVFGPSVVLASHGNNYPIMPFNHSANRFLTPFTSNSSPMLIESNPYNSVKNPHVDEEQISSGSRTSERSSAFMIDSLLESESISESESRSAESNPESSISSAIISNAPMRIERSHRGSSQFSTSAITECDYRRSADHSHNDSGLPTDRLTSTPNFKEIPSPKSVEINVVECNTPSPINATDRDQHVQFDSGIDANLHVSNGEPNSFQHLETSGKTENEVKSESSKEVSYGQAPVKAEIAKEGNDSLQQDQIKESVTEVLEHSQNGHISLPLHEQNSKFAEEDDGGVASKIHGNNSSSPSTTSGVHCSLEKLNYSTATSKSHDAIVSDAKPPLHTYSSLTEEKHHGVISDGQSLSEDTGERTQAVSRCLNTPTEGNGLSSSSSLRQTPRKRLVRDENKQPRKCPSESGKILENENHGDDSPGQGHDTEQDSNLSPKISTPKKKRCLVELQENKLNSQTLVGNQVKPEHLDFSFKPEVPNGENGNDVIEKTLSQMKNQESPHTSRTRFNSDSTASLAISSSELPSLEKEKKSHASGLSLQEIGRDGRSNSKDHTVKTKTVTNTTIPLSSTGTMEKQDKKEVPDDQNHKGSLLDLIIEKIRNAKSETEVAEAKKELEVFYKT